MKIKRVIATTVSLIMMVGISACQKTPDKDVVVDKSEGLSEEDIIKPLKKGEKRELDVPETWTEEITANNGNVIIQAKDVPVFTSDVGNTSVTEYKKSTFTKKELGKLCNFFSEGKKLYVDYGKTKEALEQDIEHMKDRKGIWGRPFAHGYLEWTQKRMENLPNKRVKREVEPEFTAPYKWVSPDETDQSQSFYYGASVGDIKETDPKIKAVTYNEKVGSYNMFQYKQGSIITEDSLKDKEEELEYCQTANLGTEEWREAFKTYIHNQKALMDPEVNGKEKYKDKAVEIMKALEISGLSLNEVSSCLWIPAQIGDTGDEMTIDFSNAIHGKVLKFTRNIGQVKGFTQEKGDMAVELPEQVYAPPFFMEELTIVFTEDGLKEFTWSNMAEKTKTIAENTKILPFSEIVNRYAKHEDYYYVYTNELNNIKEGTIKTRYVVKRVELRATNIAAFNNPKDAWLVPVWVFTHDVYSQANGEGEQYRGELEVMINAIDGGYIARSQGPTRSFE